MNETAIQKLNKIEHAITNVQTIEEGLECYARIAAIKEYGQKRKIGKDFQNSLIICELRAERKNGQILREMAERGERQKPGDTWLHAATILSPTIENLGIEKTQSHRWQLLTYIPEERFEQEIIKRQNKESSIAKKDFYILGKKYKKEADKIEQPLKIEPILYSRDAFEFLSSIEDKSVDLLLTDPPYLTEFKTIIEFEQFVIKWIPLALSKIKNTGRAYIFTGNYPNELSIYLSTLKKENSFILSNILVWAYFNTIGPLPKMKYKLNWNAVFYLYGKDAQSLNIAENKNQDLKEKFEVQVISAPDGRHEIRYSQFQKPEKLARQFIWHSTNPNDLIIDPFAGTGSFLLAAGELGRRVLGSESHEKHLIICKKRGLKVKNEI